MACPALNMNTSGQCVGRTVHRKYVAEWTNSAQGAGDKTGGSAESSLQSKHPMYNCCTFAHILQPASDLSLELHSMLPLWCNRQRSRLNSHGMRSWTFSSVLFETWVKPFATLCLHIFHRKFCLSCDSQRLRNKSRGFEALLIIYFSPANESYRSHHKIFEKNFHYNLMKQFWFA